jgi:hypothetical protein
MLTNEIRQRLGEIRDLLLPFDYTPHKMELIPPIRPAKNFSEMG